MTVMVVGNTLFSYVIGDLASVIALLNIRKSAHLQKSTAVDVFMYMNRIPVRLRQRIREHLQNSHNIDRVLPYSIVADLPKHLRTEVRRCLTCDNILGVPSHSCQHSFEDSFV